MLIDCDSCAVRGSACRDCVVGVLLEPAPVRHTDRSAVPLAPPSRPGPAERRGPTCLNRPDVDLTAQERQAIAVLAACGLVPPLRLVVRPVDPAEAGALNWEHEPTAGRSGPDRHGRAPRCGEGAA